MASAEMVKAHGELRAGGVHMILFRADQVIGILDSFALGVHIGQARAEIAQIGDQPGGGGADYGVAIPGNRIDDRAVAALGKQSFYSSVR